MKMDKFDACSKKSNIDFVAASKKNTLLPSIAHVMAIPEGPKSAMQEVVSKFLNSDMPTKDALAKLAAASKVK
jgi:glucose/mannose transport system substrate-binding protein